MPKRLTTEQFIENAIKKHGLFKQKPQYHLSGSRCPSCSKKSIGEEILKNYFKSRNIIYKSQKYYLFLDKKIYFDFYLPYYKLHIEYDGEQHFQNNKFGIVYSAIENNNNDMNKNTFINHKSYKLLRIHYEDKDNITKILDNFLKNKITPNIYYSREKYY